MTDVVIIELGVQALQLAAKIAAPLLIASLVIGVAVSLIQAVTQIQEMTLTFVPKLIGLSLILVVAGGWMMRELVTYVTTLWDAIPSLV